MISGHFSAASPFLHCAVTMTCTELVIFPASDAFLANRNMGDQVFEMARTTHGVIGCVTPLKIRSINDRMDFSLVPVYTPALRLRTELSTL